MKKKSHLSLARYLIDSMQVEELQKYRKSFLFGSVLPDCTPSFFTKRHTITGTFETLKERILEITDNYDYSQGINSEFCRHLGVVTHYIADYFTFPHNSIFKGSMKEHIGYEFKLMDYLKEYLVRKETDIFLLNGSNFNSVDKICDFIKNKHDEYIKVIKEVPMDCYYIVQLCVKVVESILQILEINMISENPRQVKVA
ncbi:MAG TPA: zinc dependent phospholipase C family protein [Clostridiales bacterium]|nr:zinc dependent phospholipase C family protein [Clostridiales bacterium]